MLFANGHTPITIKKLDPVHLSHLYLASYYISFLKQIDELLVEILQAGEAKYMAIVPEDSHFYFIDAWVRCLTSEPQIAIHPALAWHCCSKLHFRLKNDACLYGEDTDGAKAF
jgi:hypothetical protein